MPSLEQNEQSATPTIINVSSEFEPGLQMDCPFDGTLTEQKQINYSITFQGVLFEIPNVWASVCPADGEAFFNLKVDDQIRTRMFEITNPQETRLANLLNELSDD